MSTLRQLGERELIRRLAPGLPSRPDVVAGAGDDCAVVRGGDGWDLLYTTDAVIEGRHFLMGSPPESIGRKAAARAMSDIAAMGGEPTHLLVNLVASPDERVERIERVYAGLSRVCREYHVSLIGGDTACGAQLELHVFLAGRVPAGTALMRSGARPDELVYVTGALGGSIRGKHFEFKPRLAEGTWLREERWATAMIDVSDGLATDLRHILVASEIAAMLDETRIPVSPDVASVQTRRQAVEHALFDGEDFELLFTVPETRQREFEAAWALRFELPCRAIGRTQRGPPAIQMLNRQSQVVEIADGGFEHFRGV